MTRKSLLGKLKLFAPLLSTILLSCTVDLHKESAVCGKDSPVAKVEASGRDVFVFPKEQFEWHDMLGLAEPIVSDPVHSFQEIKDRLGEPDKEWVVDGRPFVRYHLSQGTLQLGLEESESGSRVYRAWRLRLTGFHQPLGQLFDPATAKCLRRLDLKRRSSISILGASRSPRLILSLKDGDLIDGLMWPPPSDNNSEELP